MSADQPHDPVAVGRQAVVVFFALAAGVGVLAGIALVLSGSRVLPLGTEGLPGRRLLLWIWLAVAVSAGLTAISFWRARVDRVLGTEPSDDTPGGPAGRARRLLIALIACWALVEAPALLAIVLFLLTGDWLLFGLGVGFAVIGLVVTAPKTKWFGNGVRS
jgi:hypothetical protein